MKKMEDIVGIKIKKVSNLLERYMLGVKAKIEKKVGEHKKVSAMQGQIMMYLYNTGRKTGVLQKEIETKFDIRSSTAAVVLGRMEKNGLVIRDISPEDVRRKRKVVRLTEDALKRLPQIHAEIEVAERRVLNGLTKRDVADLHRILDKIAENIS
ncbi:MAG: MarR family transcriptional regulator [Planctomycetes bacterium]|nr:MarR family transcriptional regulator [Planctomycetota bacterium]MCD7896276.1 MarR family transcriptional regulator [Planctomycetaceae bacterium]